MTLQADSLSLEPFSTGHEWLSQYVIGSFYFSQGDAGLQNSIDTYSVTRRPRLFLGLVKGVTDDPRLRVDKTPFIKDTSNIIIGIFQKGFHKQHDYLDVRYDVESRWKSLEYVVEPVFQHPSQLELLRRIFLGMLSREERYLLDVPLINKEDGTTIETRSSRGSVRFGRSILLEHLIDGNGAHHPVFDDMFENMRKQLLHFDNQEINVQRLQCVEEKLAEIKQRDSRDIASFFGK